MRRCLLTLACFAACKDKPLPPPPPPEPPHDGVKLIEPGTEPRQALRYHFTKGARTASTLVCDFAVKSDGQGDAVPALVVDLETAIEDVLADGSAKLRFTLGAAHARGSAQGALPHDGDAPDARTAHDDAYEPPAQTSALDGVVITALLAPDGKSSGAHVEAAGPEADKARAQLDSLVQSLEHVTTQLPAEPVGVGASWTERRTLPAGGITGVSETVYTITALTPSSFTYRSVGRLTGSAQTIEREGTKVEVTNTAGHSEGNGTVELARYALDVTASSVFSSTMNAIAPKDTPGAGSSTVEVTMATRMTPRAPGEPATPPAGEPAATPPAGEPGATPAGAPATPAGAPATPATGDPATPPAASSPSTGAAAPSADHGAHNAP